MSVLRAMVCHKGEGKTVFIGERKHRYEPAYRSARGVRALVRYALSPSRQSKGKERVVGIVDGMGLGLEEGEMLSHALASMIARQLVDGVPHGRRLLRHIILPLSGDAPFDEQLKILRLLCRRYAERCAPGYPYLAVIHDDHFGENQRGLHAHIFFRNSDANGRALDWSRDDLRAQQSMEWAAGIGVVATRGTGPSPPRTYRRPYPKAKTLDAKTLGTLTNEQIESLVRNGQLVAGRRNKSGALTSVTLNGRRIRLATIRDAAEREQRLAGSGPAWQQSAGAAAGVGIGNSVACGRPANRNSYSERWSNPSRSFGFGFGNWREEMADSRRRNRARVRGIVRAASRLVKNSLVGADKLGRAI